MDTETLVLVALFLWLSFSRAERFLHWRGPTAASRNEVQNEHRWQFRRPKNRGDDDD